MVTIKEEISDLKLNDLTQVLSFEENLLTFSLMNLLCGNHNVLNNIDFVDLNELYLELDIDDELLNEISLQIVPIEENNNNKCNYDAYSKLIDEFKDKCRIKIFNPSEDFFQPDTIINEDDTLRKFEKWTNHMKLKNNDPRVLDKLELCFLAIIIKVYCYEFVRKRCFICLNICQEPLIMNYEDANLFRPDASQLDRFVCKSCYQITNDFLMILNDSFEYQSNHFMNSPYIYVKYKGYNLNTLRETIATVNPTRSIDRSIKYLIDHNFPKVQKQLLSFNAFLNETVLKNLENRVYSISALDHVITKFTYSDVINLFEELNYVINSAFNFSHSLSRISSAFRSFCYDPEESNYKELSKFVSIFNGVNILPLRPNSELYNTIPILQDDIVYCANNDMRFSTKIWTLALVVGIHHTDSQIELRWIHTDGKLSEESFRKFFFEIAYYFVYPVRLRMFDMIICNLYLDQTAGDAYMAGFIIEDMCEQNHFRYLVWFLNGDFRYVWHHMVRKVALVDSLSKTLIPIEIIATKKSITFQNKNTIYVLHNGKWELSVVLTQDCSLVLLEHIECGKVEWTLISDCLCESFPSLKPNETIPNPPFPINLEIGEPSSDSNIL